MTDDSYTPTKISGDMQDLRYASLHTRQAVKLLVPQLVFLKLAYSTSSLLSKLSSQLQHFFIYNRKPIL